ncbi:MAG: response regulator [Candidatus Ozemobacteraceae bacterium]
MDSDFETKLPPYKRDTILIVDDQAVHRTILNMQFSEKYKIIEAESGREAIEQIRKNNECLAVILLDVVMSDMLGFEVLKVVKRENLIEEIPVIFVTIEDNPSTEIQGMALGVCDIITKPFGPDIVMRRVENVINLFRYKHCIKKLLADKFI